MISRLQGTCCVRTCPRFVEACSLDRIGLPSSEDEGVGILYPYLGLYIKKCLNKYEKSSSLFSLQNKTYLLSEMINEYQMRVSKI